jgi:predicted dienelactone hydrolase
MEPHKLSVFIISLVLVPWLLVSCATPAASMPTQVISATTPIPTSDQAATEQAATLEAMAATYDAGLTATAVAMPRYAVKGPYPVGWGDMAIQDGQDTIKITMWYPALDQGVDETPDAAHGPYPLVVFSPGMGENGGAYYPLLRPMTSYGFVVISWDRSKETSANVWRGAAERPLDILRIIHYADQATAPGGQFADLIDTEHIAVGGGSYGGWAALIGGGAQMDLGWCATHADLVVQNEGWSCNTFVPHQQEIAAMLNLKEAPMGMWPQTYDPRVDAVIALSPDGDTFGADYGGVAMVQVPTLIMAGTADNLNPPEYCAYPIYEHLGSPRKTLIVFENEWHDLGAWSKQSNLDLVNHFMNAFLLAELKGDAAAARALAPANVAFPNIKIQTTAYGP